MSQMLAAGRTAASLGRRNTQPEYRCYQGPGLLSQGGTHADSRYPRCCWALAVIAFAQFMCGFLLNLCEGVYKPSTSRVPGHGICSRVKQDVLCFKSTMKLEG